MFAILAGKGRKNNTVSSISSPLPVCQRRKNQFYLSFFSIYSCLFLFVWKGVPLLLSSPLMRVRVGSPLWGPSFPPHEQGRHPSHSVLRQRGIPLNSYIVLGFGFCELFRSLAIRISQNIQITALQMFINLSLKLAWAGWAF